MSFAGLLAWLADSVAIRALFSLGMGFISYGSVVTAFNAVLDHFSNTWVGLPTALLNIASLAGFPDAFGWIIGAMLAKVSLNSLSKIGKIPTGTA